MGKHLQRYNVEIQESSSFAIYMRRSSPENCSGLLPQENRRRYTKQKALKLVVKLKLDIFVELLEFFLRPHV